MSNLKGIWENMTGLTKGILAVVIAAGLWFGYQHLRKTGVISNKAVIETQAGGVKIERHEDAELVLAYNTFPGVEGIVFMNGGMEPNEDSRLYKDYGIKLQIKKMDVVADTREGLKSGVLDLSYCTTDVLPVEMSSGSTLLELGVKQIMKVNESRGADAIVVRPGINSVNELKGKSIAYAQATASHTLLINTLDAAGLSMSDIKEAKQSDGVEAANAFKNGQVDAAVVWAPDDADCVAAIKGAKILITTATASQIIADGLLVREDVLEEKREKIEKLVEAWLVGNAEMNNNKAARAEADKLFAKGYDFPEDIAAAAADKVRFSTLADNKAFFGLEPTFAGVTGEKMYGKMAVKYADAGLANSPASWRQVHDPSVIEDIIKKNPKLLQAPEQASEGKTTFEAPKEADKTVAAQGSKQVTVEFPSNSAVLTDDAKFIIDKEVTSIAQGFDKARIRVEGNTDNTGNPAANKVLSQQRAEAVVRYLVTEHRFDKNKFIVIGNGQDKPVADNTSEEGKAKNRRTDFQFIW